MTNSHTKVGEEMEIVKLVDLCKPIHDFLKKYFDPHCCVVISWDAVKVVRDEIGTPIKEVGRG